MADAELSFALCLAELAREMAGELHMDGNVIAAMINLSTVTAVGHRGAELVRCERRPLRPLRRPDGKVWSVKVGAIARLRSASSPVSQNS